MRVVVESHYLHRIAPCSIAFGLFHVDEPQRIRGVCLFGTPSNRNLRAGVCGPDEALNVCELTRLWCDDETPANAESFLVGNALRGAPKDIVVSYADPSAQHIGVIYQAANFLYTGLSAKRPLYTVKGEEHGHVQSVFDRLGRGKRDERGSQVAALRALYGDRVVMGQQVRKHRYVYFLGNRKRRKALRKKLRYPVEPYPKRLSTEVDEVAIWLREEETMTGIVESSPQVFTADRQDWNTPQIVVDALLRGWGSIALDPCANEGSIVPAALRVMLPTPERLAVPQPRGVRLDDGLAFDWDVIGPRLVYVNPPFGLKGKDGGATPWLRKAAEAQVAEVVVLLPARTDTAAFHDYIFGRCDALCFWRSRLRFSGARDPAPFPSVFAYFGSSPEKFTAAFGPHGKVLIQP